jgi:hypothetical protein
VDITKKELRFMSLKNARSWITVEIEKRHGTYKGNKGKRSGNISKTDGPNYGGRKSFD